MPKLFSGSHLKRRRNMAHEKRVAEVGVEEFFREDDRPTKAMLALGSMVILAALLTTVVFLFLTWSIPSSFREDFEIFGFDYGQSNKILLIVGFVATGLWSLGASFIAVELVNRSNLSRIRLVRDLTRDGALLEIFKVLKGYNGRYSENKNIEIIFEKIEEASDGFQAIGLTLTVKQRMPIDQKELVFDFITLDRGDPIPDRVELSLQSNDVPHDAIVQDITDIKTHFPDKFSEMIQGLTEVIIDSDPQNLSALDVNGIKTHRRWIFDTRQYIGGGMIDISYRYKYYVEIPGFNFFSVTEPTKGFSCSLNYDAIKDDIVVYYINMINNRIFQHDAGDFGEKRYISQRDWVIPNSNVTFCWYPKKKRFSSDREDSENLGSDLSASNLDHSKKLDVDGNCLGIALLDVHALLHIEAPFEDYSVLSEPADAADVLLQNFYVAAILKKSKVPGAEWLFSRSAKRLGVETIEHSEICDGDVVLCQRSMLQLYSIDRPELHWVVLHKDHDEWVVVDRLAARISDKYPDATISTAVELLAQDATTMIVRVRQ